MPICLPATLSRFCHQIDQEITELGQSIDELIDHGMLGGLTHDEPELVKTCQTTVELDLFLGNQ